jgi:hypothetical protein
MDLAYVVKYANPEKYKQMVQQAHDDLVKQAGLTTTASMVDTTGPSDPSGPTGPTGTLD